MTATSPPPCDARLAILVLAAGASTRMRGGDKLLEHVAGQPLIAHLSQQAHASGFAVYVTLPRLNHPRAQFTGDAHLIPVPNATQGMSASLKSGVTALADDIDGVMILPADMPEITTADLLSLAAQFAGPDGPILRATGDDHTGRSRPGHPVLFPRRCFDALKTLSGDTGARDLLKTEQVRLVPLPASHALTDLDTPEDWAVWRARPETS